MFLSKLIIILTISLSCLGVFVLSQPECEFLKSRRPNLVPLKRNTTTTIQILEEPTNKSISNLCIIPTNERCFPDGDEEKVVALEQLTKLGIRLPWGFNSPGFINLARHMYCEKGFCSARKNCSNSTDSNSPLFYDFEAVIKENTCRMMSVTRQRGTYTTRNTSIYYQNRKSVIVELCVVLDTQPCYPKNGDKAELADIRLGLEQAGLPVSDDEMLDKFVSRIAKNMYCKSGLCQERTDTCESDEYDGRTYDFCEVQNLCAEPKNNTNSLSYSQIKILVFLILSSIIRKIQSYS